jgi:Domain of unknown function (DUF4868)
VARPGGFELRPGDQTLTLIVARRSGDRVVGGHVNVANDAAAALRETAEKSLEDLQTQARRAYDPDALLEVGEFFVIPRDELDDSFGVIDLLDRGAASDLLTPEEIAERPQLFYASVIGDDAHDRLAFVSKSNPARVARSGNFFTARHEVLTHLKEDVFLFEDRVDLIVSAKDVVVLNQAAFEQWFRDTPALREKVEDWIEGISAHLPLAADGADRLAERARTDSRLRRLLYSIQSRGHLAKVTADQVRRHIAAQGLNPDEFVKGNELLFDDAEPATLMKILNEDLFRGGLTDEPFVADRKAHR